MAINFGRLGTVKLNGGARLVCTPESQITSSGGGGGGGDVTPNPTPNWTTLEYNGITGEYTYSSQQIQGIDTTITLRLEYDDTTLGTVYYNINPTDNIGNINLSFPPTSQDISNAPFTQILNNGTLTVSNNQWICFGFETNFTTNGTRTVSVKNVSDSNVLLNQFNLYNYNII